MSSCTPRRSCGSCPFKTSTGFCSTTISGSTPCPSMMQRPFSSAVPNSGTKTTPPSSSGNVQWVSTFNRFDTGKLAMAGQASQSSVSPSRSRTRRRATGSTGGFMRRELRSASITSAMTFSRPSGSRTASSGVCRLSAGNLQKDDYRPSRRRRWEKMRALDGAANRDVLIAKQ